MFARIRRKNGDPYLLLLLVLTIPALIPLTAPGYFYSAHDGRHSVFFVAMFDEAIRNGTLWPIWAMHHNQGYGYPTFLIQAPLAFYVAQGFLLLGLNVTAAVKGAWAVAFLLSAWGMYGLVRRWVLTWPQREASPLDALSPGEAKQKAGQAGLIAGLLYVYAPYHLLDLYVRAALAETMLIGWLPWVFWAFDRLIAEKLRPGWQTRLVLAAAAYTLLIFTHAFAILAATPLLAAFILFRLWVAWQHERMLAGRRWRALVAQVLMAGGAGIAGLMAAAIFLFPLLSEGPLLSQEDWVSETYLYTRHFVHWGQFFSPFWGYGYSDDPIGANDGMGFQLGALMVIFAWTAFVLLGARTRMGHRRSLSTFLLLAAAVLLYMMTSAAAWLWETISLLEVMQFPWRLLTLAIFVLGALGGLTAWQLSDWMPGQSHREAALLILAIAVLFAGVGYARPASLEPIEPWREDGRAVFQFESQHPDMLGYTNFVQERFTETPLTAQYAAALAQGNAAFDPNQLERLGILSGEGEVTDTYSRSHRFGGEVVMQTPGVVQIRLFAFPGWQVRLDGQLVDYRISSPHGVMEIDVPAGVHRIDVEMGSTPARTAGAILSGLTVAGWIGLLVAGRRSRRAT